jgi:hypothetical protein
MKREHHRKRNHRLQGQVLECSRLHYQKRNLHQPLVPGLQAQEY